MLWDELSRPWRCCLEEAWEAYRAGSLPIGAVVTDAAGNVLSRGRSRISHRDAEPPYLHDSPLAHAEVNALIALDYRANDPPHDCILYTTTEPCPMCLGTFYMSGLRELRYASREPFAGSVNLLGTTPYLSRKRIKVIAPEHPDLEAAILAMHAEVRLRENGGEEGAVVVAWAGELPLGVRLGKELLATEELRRMREAATPIPEVIAALLERLREVSDGRARRRPARGGL